MEIEITIEKNRELLINSDRYGRIYNGASQYMVEPIRILESFNQPLSMIKLGSPTLIEKEEEEALKHQIIIIKQSRERERKKERAERRNVLIVSEGGK